MHNLVERDALKAENDRLRGENAMGRTVLDRTVVERDEAIRERDRAQEEAGNYAAVADDLDVSLRATQKDVATLLEAIAAFRSRQVDGRNTIDAYGDLFAAANEIAKRTGYAGGQGDG